MAADAVEYAANVVVDYTAAVVAVDTADLLLLLQ